MSTPNDSIMIQRYLAGDTEALSELVECYRRPLFGFILRMTHHAEEAEEIFQDVWVRAINNLPRYQQKSRFLSWLFRIAHNLVVDRVRRRKPVITLDDEAQTDRLAFDATDEYRSPASRLQEQDLHLRIQHAVSQLPIEQREVFLMRMEADLPFKEIARIQKTSINTALARMSYAINKLRVLLKEDYQDL